MDDLSKRKHKELAFYSQFQSKIRLFDFVGWLAISVPTLWNLYFDGFEQRLFGEKAAILNLGTDIAPIAL
ncbi:MAG: hypothetical protein WCS42_14770 [Verrucomicrobiota bacterium]